MTDVQIRSFLTLAEELSFTKASKRLCITQSTLSSHIASLEKNMGVSLFDRNNKTVALSAEGEIIYPAFKQALSLMEGSIDEAKTVTHGNVNLLRIAFIDGMHYSVMSRVMKMINGFRKKYPTVDVQVLSTNESEQMNMLKNNQLDMAFSFGCVTDMKSDLEGKMMYESYLCILYLKELYGEKEAITWEDLKDKTFYVISRENSLVEEAYLRVLQKKFGENQLKVARVNSMEAKMFYVSAGYGVGFADQMTRISEPECFGQYPIYDIGLQYGFIYMKNKKNIMMNRFFEYLDTYYEAT